MSTDVHQDFLMDLVDVVSNCLGEYHFVLDCVPLFLKFDPVTCFFQFFQTKYTDLDLTEA